MVKLLRVHHYIKNFFIFLPLFFALEITEFDKLLSAYWAFIGFSAIASTIYIFNDIMDIKTDQQHPTKKFRPIASGQVTTTKARVLMLCCLLFGGIILYCVNIHAFLYAGAYLLINIAYSTRLKHIAILDIAIIGTGFVLRLFIGSAAAGIPLSLWIISMTFLLALFLALAKRRDDVRIFMQTGQKMRAVVDGYNLEFVNAAMVSMAAVVIVFYALYTVSADVVTKLGTDKLYFTTAFVIVAILRYMQLTFVHNNSGNPTELLLRDPFIQITLTGWLTVFGCIIYF